MSEDNLVSSPPMDVVIQKRHAALKYAAEQKRREKELKPAKAKDGYNSLLRTFANKYFKGRTNYDGLSPQEQKALAKICLRQSLKTSTLTLLSAGAVPATMALLGETTGDMIGLGYVGLLLAAALIGAAEVVLGFTNSFHIYEGLEFIQKYLYLKRKKLL